MTDKLIVSELPVTAEFRRERRIVQDRGELALIEDGLPIRHLGYFTLNVGDGLYRGGHCHRKKTEHFYVVSGRAVIRWVDTETGERGATEIKTGDKAVILPGLAHRFEALEPLAVIEYFAGVYEAEDDVPFRDF